MNVRERLHPITMAALVYLLLSHVTAFASFTGSRRKKPAKMNSSMPGGSGALAYC